MSRKFELTKPRRKRGKTERYSISKDVYRYNMGYKDGLKKGKQQALKDVLKIIDKITQEQMIIYEEMKDGRTKRMKDNNSKNWGMQEAEYRIEHYQELKQQISKELTGGKND